MFSRAIRFARSDSFSEVSSGGSFAAGAFVAAASLRRFLAASRRVEKSWSGTGAVFTDSATADGAGSATGLGDLGTTMADDGGKVFGTTG